MNQQSACAIGQGLTRVWWDTCMAAFEYNKLHIHIDQRTVLSGFLEHRDLDIDKCAMFVYLTAGITTSSLDPFKTSFSAIRDNLQACVDTFQDFITFSETEKKWRLLLEDNNKPLHLDPKATRNPRNQDLPYKAERLAVAL